MRPFLLFSTLFAGTLFACAQLHSPQVTLHRAEKPEDLSWMWSYATAAPGGDESKLAGDPRFGSVLAHSLLAPQSFWGRGRSLADAATAFLTGTPGAVINDDNRYLTADACVQDFCSDRGLLWVDLGLPRPLIVFAAIDWISDNKTVDQRDAAYTMWIFSNRALTPEHIPSALRRSVARWTVQPPVSGQALANITRVFLVDPDGTPHPLSPDTPGAHTTLPAETGSETKVQP